jgi:hypothetical protein
LPENEREAERMQSPTKRKVAILLLAALMTAPTVFAVAPAITDTDERAGLRISSSPGSREST